MLSNEQDTKVTGLPLLCFDVCLRETDDRIELVRNGMQVTQVDITGGNLADIRQFLSNIDGTHRLGEIPSPESIDEQTGNMLLHKLIDAEMIQLVPDRQHPLVDSADFADTCRYIFPEWKQHLFGHSLWRRLTNGSASWEQFAGWLLENYHFIEGATIRMPMVIAHCRHAGIRRQFIKHFSEEFDHHHFFMRSLKALGMSEEEVFSHKPLPGTMAVLNHMRDCGKSDPLAYATCSAFLESTGTDRATARQFFERLLDHYDNQCGKIVKPMAEHVKLDEEYGHGSFLEKICNEIPHIEVRRADAALQAVFTLVETLQLWSTDIERYYANHAPITDPDAPRLYRCANKWEELNV